MHIESFDQARTLDRDALLELLASDRPEQRVWAIWALAIRLGPGDLPGRVGREPDPGVRRTLAVILASHGETDLLVALARHDPELVVRESAIQLVTRLAAGGAIDRAVVEQAVTTQPEIRIAVLGAIGAGAPAFLVAIAHRVLAATEFDVQAEAFEALLRIGTREAHEDARTWMLRLQQPWTVIDRWLRAADIESLADAFAGAPVYTRGMVLAQLKSPGWMVVAELIGEDLELLRAMLRRTDVQIPAHVLADAIQRGAHIGFLERLVAQLAIAGQGRQLLVDLRGAIEDGPPEDAAGRETLDRLFERTHRFADALEITQRALVLREVASQHPVEQLLGLENAVGRWLAETDAPADLIPVLPELHRYCSERVATIQRTPRRRRRFRELAAPGAETPPQFTDERQLFENLLGSLDRILMRS